MTKEDLDKKSEEVERFNLVFTAQHQEALDAWKAKYPGRRPPVTQDDDGRFVWINRKARRNAKVRL